MSISEHIPGNIKSVARCIGYAAWLDTTDDWLRLPVVLQARLEPRQCAALAYAALRTLTPEQVVDVANTVLPDRTAPPIPPLFSYMDEAAFWADMAEPEALEAYCLASFHAMPAPRKAAFLEFVQGRRVA